MQLANINNIQNFQDSIEQSEYYNRGFIEAGTHKGDISALELGLKKIWDEFMEIRRTEISSKEKTQDEMRSRADEIARQNAKVNEQIEKLDGEIIEEQEHIKEIKTEINSIKRTPEKHISEKPDKFTYYITLTLITGITAYLWVYYTSTMYSAFFRSFTLDENIVVNSIFYPKAITESFKAGLLAFLLILIAPVVFLGIGYLYHRYREAKVKVKTIVILAITFVFDGILAYEICKKIADIEASNSFAEVSAYTLHSAFTDVNFWLILFAGFVVYLIWGEIFTFFNDARNSLDKVKVLVDSRESTIEEHKSAIEILKNKKKELHGNISSNTEEIEKINSEVFTIHYDVSEIMPRINDYGRGWLLYMKNAGQNEVIINRAFEQIKSFNKIEEN